MSDDTELLRAYAEEGSEAAFATFVRRYLPLVYQAALRQCGGRSADAEEVAQAVFAIAARKARLLASHPTVVGWLYSATFRMASDARRREQRRRSREIASADLIAMNGNETDWPRVRPLLDRTLLELRSEDRELILLRFFQNQAFSDLAARAGMTEDGARMRVNRALVRLRRGLARHGVTSTEAALGTFLLSEAAQAAPPGLAETIATGAVQAGFSNAAGASAIMSIQKSVFVGVLAVAVMGTCWYGTLRWRDEHGRAAMNGSGTGSGADGAIAGRLRHPTGNTDANVAAAGKTPAPEPSDASEDVPVKAVAQALDSERERHAKAATAPLKFGVKPLRNVGLDTAQHALESFSWACYHSDNEALAGMIYLDENARNAAQALMAKLPADERTQFASPESFVAMMLAYEVIAHPGPDAEEFFESAPRLTQISASEFKSTNGLIFTQTAQGWKWAIPSAGVTAMCQAALTGATDATARSP